MKQIQRSDIIMIDGFDFGFSPEGEITIDELTHDIKKQTKDDLRVQLAYNRVKSISRTWYVDKIGADLEEIIGRPCTKEVVDYGKFKIIEAITFDNTWSREDIFIKAAIIDNTKITYNIYLKIVQQETEDTYSYEIIAELDLVKGVFVRYGWEPRK